MGRVVGAGLKVEDELGCAECEELITGGGDDGLVVSGLECGEAGLKASDERAERGYIL